MNDVPTKAEIQAGLQMAGRSPLAASVEAEHVVRHFEAIEAEN